MPTYLVVTFLLTSAFVIYTAISSFLAKRRHAQRAAELGCKPALWRPYKWPLGIDMVWRLIKADRAQVVPDELVRITNELGVRTWEQNFIGDLSIVTIDPKNIQAILATQFNDFALGETRRGNFFPLLGNGIFTADGKGWEHSRAMLRPQFARDQISDLNLEEIHVQDLFRHLQSSSAARNGWTDRVDLSPLFFRLTLDSATEFLFGESVDSQITALSDGSGEEIVATADHGKLDWSRFAHCFDGATKALGSRARLSEKYWLYSPRSFHDSCKEVHKFADYYVNLALRTDLSSLKNDSVEKGGKKEKYIFLQELVKTTRDPIELRSQLLNILIAGRDTTAGLLGWTFYLLVRNPEIYDKLRNVVLENFGDYNDPRDITFANLKACTYLQQVLSEVLRLFANVPVNSRRAIKDTTLPRGGGSDELSPVYVKKGQEVNYIVHAMHRNKDIWGPDAAEFKPDRWIGRKPGWEFLPFNGGPRICLGQQFALTEAGYVIVRIMQRYDKMSNEGHDPITRHNLSLTTAPVDVWVKMHEAGQ